MTPTIPVIGYGHNPHEEGVLMAICPEAAFAFDIVGALCAKHPGQWFGYMTHDGKYRKRCNRVEEV